MTDMIIENTKLLEVIDDPKKYNLKKFNIKDSMFLQTFLYGIKMYHQVSENNFLSYMRNCFNFVSSINGYEIEDDCILIYYNNNFLGIYSDIDNHNDIPYVGDIIILDECVSFNLKKTIISMYSEYMLKESDNFYNKDNFKNVINCEESVSINYIRLHYNLYNGHKYSITDNDSSFYKISILPTNSASNIINYKNCTTKKVIAELHALSDLGINKESISKINSILKDNDIVLLLSNDFKFYVVSINDLIIF